MKKLLLLLLPFFAMSQSPDATQIENILLLNNTEQTSATRVIVQDAFTKELKFVLKASLVPQANASTSGTVRTTTAEVNPQVYTIAIADNLLNAKVDKTTTVNGKALSTNVVLNSNDVGLGNVNNTSDANKPISSATQAALNLKANTSALSAYLPLLGGTLFINGTFSPEIKLRNDTNIMGFDYSNAKEFRFIDRVLNTVPVKINLATGTITASPATASNELVTKAQLDANSATSGTFAPTLTGANVTITFDRCYFTKVGNVLTVVLNGIFNSSISTGFSSSIAVPSPFTIISPSFPRILGKGILVAPTGNTFIGTVNIQEINSATAAVGISFRNNTSGDLTFNVSYSVLVN